MTISSLPVSPIAPTSSGPAAQAGVVQINLNATTGQIVTGAEFGLSTTMGDYNHTYLPYADPALQAVVNQYPTDLLRHNWELNTMMDLIYPSRGSAAAPNFTNIDTYLKQQGNLTGFLKNGTATQIVTLGFPSWLNIANSADQQLFGNMVKAIAQHFIAMGEPVGNYELVNEPDGFYTATDMANMFNVVAQALKSVDPSYKLGGLTETYPRMDDLQTFFRIAGPNIGFVSYHQYVTNGSDGKNDQQVVSDSLTSSLQGPAQVRALMQANGISNNVPIFLGEYNVDGANFDDPNNGNMVGAVAAAAVTYGMIASNSNATMGALWCAENGSAYSVFGGVGNYYADPIGVVLSDLTQYMPGNIVNTTMPSNTPGLVGYTTQYGQGFSTALIDTSLSVGYTVDLSHDGLPTTGLFRVEVSNAHPGGIKTAITDLSHVSVAAGSVVIITNEAPHGGTEFDGTQIVTPTPTPTATPTLTPSPDGTKITSAAANPILDHAGHAWTLVQSGSNGLQIAVNGTVDTATANVVLLETLGGNIIQENAAGNWYLAPARGATWTQIAAPATAPASAVPPVPSPDGTIITTAAASPIIDPAGHAWTLVQSASNGLQIAVNGTVDQATRNVVLLETLSGNIIQENASGNWYSAPAPGATWTQIATPAPVTPPFSPAPVTTGTGSDTLVLSISEDAYHGDAQFTVSVDGKQLGGTFTTTASRAAGSQPELYLQW